jgi:hypothetical protein
MAARQLAKLLSTTIGPDNLPGRIGVGGYHHTGGFLRYDGTDQSGTSGMYAVFDQTIFQGPAPAAGSSAATPGIGWAVRARVPISCEDQMAER